MKVKLHFHVKLITVIFNGKNDTPQIGNYMLIIICTYIHIGIAHAFKNTKDYILL